MINNTSIATIDSPEFIQVTPHNDLISECEIKVLYLGENRNRSYISKEVAIEMANSLPCAPIIAAYIEKKEDFGDHGEVITIEDGEVKTSRKTVPYGFVSPDAKIWFQKFIDVDDRGEETEREYLMTTGYLWTGRYPEIRQVITEGQPQSMELDEKTLDGHWAKNSNSNYEFFIINDAVFSGLCVLGSDVEPCFEGASIAACNCYAANEQDNAVPEFVTSLLEMRQELYALQNEGGSDMLVENEEVVETEFEAVEQPVEVEAPAVEFEDAGSESSADSAGESTDSTDGTENSGAEAEGEDAENSDSSSEETGESEEQTDEPTEEEPEQSETEDAEDEPEATEGEENSDNYEIELNTTPSRGRQDFELSEEDADSEFACGKKKNYEDEEEEKKEEEEETPAEESEEEDEKKPSADHSLDEVEAKFAATQAELESVKAEFTALKAEYEAASAELKSLRNFKLGIENQRKEQEIAKYSMFINEELLADIRANISEYSLDEIKSKLAVLYVENNVNFSVEDEVVNIEEEVVEESPITTFSLEAPVDAAFVPEWIKALHDAKN